MIPFQYELFICSIIHLFICIKTRPSRCVFPPTRERALKLRDPVRYTPHGLTFLTFLTSLTSLRHEFRMLCTCFTSYYCELI